MLNVLEEKLYFVNTSGVYTGTLANDITVTSVSYTSTSAKEFRIYCTTTTPPVNGSSFYSNKTTQLSFDTLFYCPDSIYIETDGSSWIGITGVKGNYASTTEYYTSLTTSPQATSTQYISNMTSGDVLIATLLILYIAIVITTLSVISQPYRHIRRHYLGNNEIEGKRIYDL